MDQRAKALLEKYRIGQCTPQEAALVERYFNQHILLSEKTPTLADFEHVSRQLRNRIYQHSKPRKALFATWLYVAAALFIVAAAALYFYRSGTIVNHNPPIVNEIRPGGNRATLTLADGTQINLDSAKTGIQINDGDIHYNDGTAIGANEAPRAPETYHVERTTYNSLSIPRGGQYQIILPDGTKVWLNAASILKYPSKFTGDRREVELEGEAYFLVAKSGRRKAESQEIVDPFIVKSKNQSVTVLGTEFNVAAYADEKETKTTLVEGKVQVRSQNLPLKTYNVQLLSPQQQAVVKGDSLTVSKADIESTIAWRNGLFSFNDEPLEVIMRKIARWYNVDVTYQGANKQERFGGGVSRYDDVSTVLKRLETAGHVHFKIEGRRIIVMD